MKEHEISTPQDLEVALSASALRKRSQLWKVAEGRSIRWIEAAGVVLALFLFGLGITQSIEAGSQGMVQIAMALMMIVSFVCTHIWRQLNALVEIVKRLENERP